MKKSVFLFLFFPFVLFSQIEQYPRFKDCHQEDAKELKKCFLLQTNTVFYKKFTPSNALLKATYNKRLSVAFIVDKEGFFNVIQVEPPLKALKEQVVQVFEHFPKVQPALYNKKPKEMSFVLPIIVETIYPIFKECEKSPLSKTKNCFYKATNKAFFKEFKTPRILKKEKFNGIVNVVFEVTKEGKFKLIRVQSSYKELKIEVERVFSKLPTIKPAVHQAKKIDMRFDFPLRFPINYLTTKKINLN